MVRADINIFEIREIYKDYCEMYDKLYNVEDNVEGYDEALDFYLDNFDELIKDKNFEKYLYTLATLKFDAFTSDREIVALVMACRKHGLFLD